MANEVGCERQNSRPRNVYFRWFVYSFARPITILFGDITLHVVGWASTCSMIRIKCTVVLCSIRRKKVSGKGCMATERKEL